MPEYVSILDEYQNQITTSQNLGRIGAGSISREQMAQWWQQRQAPQWEPAPEREEPSWISKGLGAMGSFFERGGAGLYGAVANFGQEQPFQQTLEQYRELPMWAQIPLEMAHPAGVIPVTGALKMGGLAARGAKLGTAARGLEATAAGLDIAAKVPGKAIGAISRTRAVVKPLEFISNADIISRAWKPDVLKRVSETLGEIPGVRGVARRTVGPAAITKDTDVAARASVVHGNILEQGRSSFTTIEASLRNTVPDARKLFNITDDAVAHLSRQAGVPSSGIGKVTWDLARQRIAKENDIVKALQDGINTYYKGELDASSWQSFAMRMQKHLDDYQAWIKQHPELESLEIYTEDNFWTPLFGANIDGIVRDIRSLPLPAVTDIPRFEAYIQNQFAMQQMFKNAMAGKIPVRITKATPTISQDVKDILAKSRAAIDRSQHARGGPGILVDRELERLQIQGFNMDKAWEALKQYDTFIGTQAGKLSSAEFKSTRDSLWGKLLQAIDNMTKAVEPSAAIPKTLNVPIYDLLDNPAKYKALLTPEQQQGVDALLQARDYAANMYRKEGIWPELAEEGSDFFHRSVLGVQTSQGVAAKPMTSLRGEAGMMKRIYSSQAEGIKKGIAYEPDPVKSVLSQIQSGVKIVAKKRTQEAVTDAMAKTIAKKPRRAGLGWVNLTGDEARNLGLTPKKVKSSGGVWETVSAEEAAKRGIITDGPIEMITMAERAVSERPLKGIVFPEAIARDIEAAFNTEAQGWLKRMATVSAAGRMFVAALDLSAPFIQGLPLLGRRPDLWTKAVGKQLQFFAKPNNLRKYVAENQAVIEEMRAAGSVFQPFEFFEAMAPLQKALPFAKKGLQQTYGRAEAAFTGYSAVARVEMWKAFAPSVSRKFGQEGLDDLARSLDRMTGVMSTEALGLTGTQRAFETAFVFFSPRYTRAGFALVGDLLKGPFRLGGRPLEHVSGQMAWRSLGQLAAGGFAMFYGVSRAMGLSHEETMKRMDPRKATFMTLEIDGKPIGIGGALYGIVRLAGNIAAAGSDVLEGEKSVWDIVKPFDEGGLNRWDNPFIRFMMGKSSPLTSGISLLIEEENYFGEPFETPADYASFLGSRVLPIWVQSQVVEGEPSPLTAVAEIGGLRTWALGPEYEAGKLKDQFAQEMFQKDWSKLEIDQQSQIRQSHPEIEQAELQSQEVWAKRGFADAQQWLDWQKDLDDIQQNVWLGPLSEASSRFDVGKISGYKYRELTGQIGASYGAAIEKLEREYPDIYKDLASKEIDPDKRFNVALFEYNRDVRFADDLETPDGYDWDEKNKREAQWQQKWPDMVQRLETHLESQRKNEPRAYQMLRWARDVLKEYWEVERGVLQEYGLWETEQQASQLDNMRRTDEADYLREVSGIKQLKSLISDYRSYMRQTDPSVKKAYEMFYAR